VPIRGSLEPLATDTDGAGKVYLAVAVKGIKQFSPSFSDTDQASFITHIDPDPTDKYKSVQYPATFAASGMGLPGARATGTSWINGTLYVTGIFAGDLELPGFNITVTNNNTNGEAAATPFLGIFQATASSPPTLLSFDAFSGGDACYGATPVFLAARDKAVALAGAWRFDLDLTTVVGTVDGNLKSPSPSTNSDAFVAYFSPPP